MSASIITRRAALTGTFAGAAAIVAGATVAPAIAHAMSPEERLRLAVLELQDAMRAMWPDRRTQLLDMQDARTPAFYFAAWSKDRGT